MKLARRIGKALLAFVLVFAATFFAAMVYFGLFRPNAAQVKTDLVETWTIVSDGLHNSNTDLTYFRGRYYLAHAISPFHMGTARSRIALKTSTDMRTWTTVRDFSVPDTDVRDPKLAVIGGRLFLYILTNQGFEPAPSGTSLTISDDGVNFGPIQKVEPDGWLLWRPKTRDGRVYYVTGYWHEHGKSALFKSTDMVHWELVSTIHMGDRNDETDMEFLPNGNILATARLEGDRSWHQGAFDASTLIAVAEPPYARWTKTISRETRLDGPALFRVGDRIFAVARRDPEGYERWYGMSSLLGRKRTALWEVTPEKLRFITDFPSAGDTSYAGVVVEDESLQVTYYTNNPQRDYDWLLGLIMPTEIRGARVRLAGLK